MNQTNVPNSILERLQQEWDALTPEARKAARYVLENPADVGVSTVREIAEAAQVKPNTVVRMARQVGFEGYEDFRTPFRDAIRKGNISFHDRARWLQQIERQGAIGELYADMVNAAISNIEETFAGIDSRALQEAANAILQARKVYTLGVGVNSANAQNFTYLASTGMVDFAAIPQTGRIVSDELAWADEQDVLVAITCKPYRREITEGMQQALDQGLTIIGLSDSLASPIIRHSQHPFVVATATPQFFPSSVAIIALLETLLSFVIAQSGDNIIDRVERFHQRRQQQGVYVEEQS